jgi:hypothetical protein
MLRREIKNFKNSSPFWQHAIGTHDPNMTISENFSSKPDDFGCLLFLLHKIQNSFALVVDLFFW